MVLNGLEDQGLIDNLIASGKRELRTGGSNKKCFLFDDYVLLYGSFKEEELKQVMTIEQDLAGQGVNVLPTLDYRIEVAATGLGFVKGYLLQRRARGSELYRRDMSEAQYAQRVREIAEMSPEKTDKFVADWMAITNAGLRIDPSKCENFFYDEGKIHFIDMNQQKRPVSIKMSFAEAANVLMGLGRKSPKYGEDLARIVENVAGAFLKQGLGADDIRDVVSGYTYFLSPKQIEWVVGSLKKTNPQANIWQMRRRIGGR